MDDTIDLLQIKIENAKKQLSDDTLNAIAAVPWQAEIIKMRETKGFTFEQLGDLELETELLFCGLISSKDYPKELENRMKISKAAANELVMEMNKLIFSRIKEEMIKSAEHKKIFAQSIPPRLVEEGVGGGNSKENHLAFGTPPQKGGEGNHDTEKEKENNTQILKSAGIEILNGNGKKETLPIPGKLELSTPAKATPEEGNNTIHPMLAQKMSGSLQIPSVKTEHTLENITKVNTPVPTDTKPKIPKADPYREIPE